MHALHRMDWSGVVSVIGAITLTVLLAACQSTETSEDRGASGSALLEAVKIGDNARVAILLAEGAYTEVRDEKGDTPLLYAVKTGNVQCVRMLLNYDVDRAARSGNGKGPLELALDSGNQPMVHTLIKGGVPADEVGHDGNPLLHKAVRFNDTQTIKVLLEENANPNAPGKEGRTPLHIAVENGLPECISTLFKAGADANLADDSGISPLWFTSRVNDPRKRKVMVSQMLEQGADPTLEGTDEECLLSRFVSKGWHAEAVQLINYGAYVDERAGASVSLLELARQRSDDEMLEILLSRGADGADLLDGALSDGDVGLLQLLFQYGVSLEARGESEKESLIASSVRKSDLGLAELLLSNGADPDEKCKEGQPPLHMAVAMRDPEMVRLLLEYGADPNIRFARPVSKSFLKLTEKESMQWFLKNERRLTPLMMAANNGDVEIIAALLGHGAKKYVYSGRHRLYPVNFASRRGDVKSMQVILGQDPENEKMHAVLDLSEQRVRLYDNKGKVIFSSRVSTGKRGFRTPTGTFVITDKHRTHTSSIYGSSMPFFQRLSCSAFGFHYGVCPGYPASHGCIRMPWSSAKKLFSLTPVGTRVIIQK